MSSSPIPNTKRPMAGLTDTGLPVKAAKKHKADKSDSSCPIPKTEVPMAALIDTGCLVKAAKEYKADEFKHALELSISIMRSCPCASGVERDMCTCKDFEKVATQGGSIFREALHTCHCDVGKNFSQCDNGHHIQALCSRAETFEEMGKLDDAMKDAEWILELAPRLPDVSSPL
ncbi:hypothetical protein E4U11_004395 [Claviceps purpurea]|nr:hypothetical protein E4U11_004395 [Claviceps purpurea]